MKHPHFMARLQNRAKDIQSRLCVGIDPHPYLVGEDATAETLVHWVTDLVQKTAPYALCFKLNIAFFEAFGAQGLQAAQTLAPIISRAAPLLLDAKRGDISSTAAAYASAAFEALGAQAITLNPYLGFESLDPFFAYPEAGFFLLCHTSNPGATQLQGRTSADGMSLDEFVAHTAQHHAAHERIGLVVGATKIQALRRIRQYAPSSWLLCPGIGAQGGNLQEAVAAAWGTHGHVLISASRSIASAADPSQEARRLRDAINAAAPSPQEVTTTDSWSHARRTLARGLVQQGCVLFGEFTLKSGLKSPVYLDLRRLTGQPALFRAATLVYQEVLATMEGIQGLAGLPMAGLPLASALALQANLPMAYPRPPKKHGTGATIEGGLPTDLRLTLVDDLATRGQSALESLPTMREAGYDVRDLLVLIDRQSGARQRLAQQQVTLHAAFTFTELLHFWRQEDLLSTQQHQACLDFVSQTQSPEHG